MRLSAAALTRRFSIAIALSWSVPAIMSLFFLEVAELPPRFSGLSDLGWLSYGYCGLAVVAAVLVLRRAMASVVADQSGPDASDRRFRRLGRLALLTVILVFSHLLVGATLVMLDAGLLWDAAPSSLLLFLGLVGLLALVILTPLYVYCHGLFGEFFGRHLGSRAIMPISVRMVVVGMGVCVVAAGFGPLYQFIETGAIPPELLLVSGAQIGYAALVAFIAYRGQTRSLQPLERLLSVHRVEDRGNLQQISARSLDEIGVFTTQLRDQLLARLDYEQELEASEARTLMFAQSASDYFFEIDEDLNFSFISERFEELTGIPGALIVGQSAVDMGKGYVSAEAQRHLEDLRAHRPYRSYRFSVTTRNGGSLHLQVSALPIFDGEGRFRGYRGTGTNVTDYVEAQHQLIEKEAQLAQAQNMEAVGQLTGGLAHDFNNFLTTIMGNLELVLAQEDVSVTGRRYANAALDAAQRGALLVQRLLAFSRRQSLNPQPTEVGSLLAAMGDLLRPALGENVALELDIGCAPAACMVDRSQLEQVFLNLAINARDAMPDGGRLRIVLSNLDVGAEDASRLAPGSYVRIEVSDTGTGIPEDQLLHVFEPFFTTKDPGAGSGLGLSMVYGFVAQSGGRVSVANRHSGGVRVEMLLPAASQVNDEIPVEKPFSAGGDGHRLLVVEDDPALSQLVTHNLEELGYQVVAVSEGQQAMEFLDSHPDVDLVLCDVVLAGERSGLDVARHLAETEHGARVLLMSGYAETEIERQGPLQDGMQLLHKPFHRRQLAERVAELLSQPHAGDRRRAG